MELMYSLLLISCAHILRCAAAGDADPMASEQRLYGHLMRHYDGAVRPVRNASTPVVVKLGLTITKAPAVHEAKNIIELHVWMEQEWVDELLVWQPDSFGGIQSFAVPVDRIWQPDILLYNDADPGVKPVERGRVMVYHDGKVFYAPAKTLKSTCALNFTYYPFDVHFCHMKFGSWSYHGFHVDVTNRSADLTLDTASYNPHGTFELVSTKLKRRVVRYTCCPEPYPDVTAFLELKRKGSIYKPFVVLPCLANTILVLLVFCLPADSKEKIGLGITLLLIFTIFVCALDYKLPVNDTVPRIRSYLVFVLVLIALSVALSVLVIRFHYTGHYSSMPACLRTVFVNALGKVLCVRPSGELYDRLCNTAQNTNADETKPHPAGGDASAQRTAGVAAVELARLRSVIEWRCAAAVLDRVFFILFFIAAVVFTLEITVFGPMWAHADFERRKHDFEMGDIQW